MKTKIRFIVVGFIIANVLTSTESTRAATWTQKADMPTPRWINSAAVVNGKIYVIGGLTSETDFLNGQPISAVEEYNPTTDTWTRKADMPEPRAGSEGSHPVVDGKIYVIGGAGRGGRTSIARVDVYDPATDTWSRAADMPTAKMMLPSVAWGGKIYTFGGLTGTLHSSIGTTTLRVTEVYDPKTDTWAQATSMPYAVWGHSAVEVSDKIYVIGGASGRDAMRLLQVYDPQTDTWTEATPMPLSTRDFGATAVCGKIYAFGGWLNSGLRPFAEAWVYEPATDTWTEGVPLPDFRATLAISTVNGKIYAIGGTPRQHNCQATTTVYELDFELGFPQFDFNGDGIVDGADVSLMVDYWGTDEPLYDIAPAPCGDGIVDVQDLIDLAEHLFEGYDTVIDRRISAGSDDAEEALNTGFTSDNDSSDLEIVDDHKGNGGGQLIGLIFRDIYIPPEEVISNAYIEFVCDETKNGTDDAYFLIWGHLTPNPDGFIEPFMISDRPKTEAKVPWAPDPWNAVGQKIQTVNIAPIIQELINQEGWAAGNAVEIIIGADPSIPVFTGVRCVESFDGDPWNAPLLHIEISVP